MRMSDNHTTEKAVWGVEDVAAFLDVTPDTVRDQARRALLPGRKVGKEWRFSRRAVIAWLEGTDPNGELSPDDWAAIRKGLDDVHQGRVQALTDYDRNEACEVYDSAGPRNDSGSAKVTAFRTNGTYYDEPPSPRSRLHNEVRTIYRELLSGEGHRHTHGRVQPGLKA